MYLSTNFNTTVPKLYEQQGKDEQIAYVKYCVPNSDWIWYILEYSELQKLFYGYLEPEGEYVYFTVEELKRVVYTYDVDIELDITFKPQLLKELMI